MSNSNVFNFNHKLLFASHIAHGNVFYFSTAYQKGGVRILDVMCMRESSVRACVFVYMCIRMLVTQCMYVCVSGCSFVFVRVCV